MGLGASPHNEQQRAVIRAYGGMAKAAVREWIRHGSLSRAELKVLLGATLLTTVGEVFPQIAVPARPARGRRV